jgi:hypothetical protein
MHTDSLACMDFELEEEEEGVGNGVEIVDGESTCLHLGQVDCVG